jgi:hypothetical protein
MALSPNYVSRINFTNFAKEEIKIQSKHLSNQLTEYKIQPQQTQPIEGFFSGAIDPITNLRLQTKSGVDTPSMVVANEPN